MKIDGLIEIIKGQNVDKYDTLVLLKEIIKQDGFNEFKASEMAENEIIVFVNEVQSLVNESNRLNITCLFTKINRSIAIVNRDYFKIQNIKEQLNALSWQDFEKFCGLLMRRCFKAKSNFITQPTSDGGVDFEARLPIEAINCASAFIDIELFGQAKKYASNVQRNDIDKFTAFASKCKRDGNAYKYSPQLFMFCTTSDFAKSASEEIKKNQFLGLNGLQIATMVFNEMLPEKINSLNEFIEANK